MAFWTDYNRPESATMRQESEMADSSNKELHTANCTRDPIERIRLLCLSRGATGILDFGRLLRILDKDGGTNLNQQEFLFGLKEIGLQLTQDEAKQIFKKFDTNGDGSVNIDIFLEHVRPPLNESRKKVIDMAFQKMDKHSEGEITVDYLKRIYNVKDDPLYISGEHTEESILTKVLDIFQTNQVKDGKVTREEFLNYYTGVSASIDNDGYFDLMMRQSYKL